MTERAALAAICLHCHRGRVAHLESLCGGCWSLLSPRTRARLQQRDHEAQNRLFQLFSALVRGVPLPQIQVAA